MSALDHSHSELSFSPRQVTQVLVLSGILFLASGLTVFLPYFSVEIPRSQFDPSSGHTYRYTGVELLSGSYGARADVASDASDGTVDVVLVLLAVVLGLATLVSRRHRGVAWALGISTLVVLIGGYASTVEVFSVPGVPGVHEHLQVGFALGVLFIAGATVARVILWRVPARDAASPPAKAAG